jgi:hypothetical protein
MMMRSTEVKFELLTGWKNIARHLGMGVRTAQRYELMAALPIRRPAGRPRTAVIATIGELDAWVSASPLRQSFLLSPIVRDDGALLKELKLGIAEMHQLRHESAELRKDLKTALNLLTFNLRAMRESEEASPDLLKTLGLAARIYKNKNAMI